MPKGVVYASDEIVARGLDPEQIPRHVAIIMDGNGRWAKARHLPRIEGHRRGMKSVRLIIEESSRLGLEQLTLYCLSRENWKRPPAELQRLLRLFEQYLVEERSNMMEQDLPFALIGDRNDLSDGILREVEKTTEWTSNNGGMRLCLAVNYGGRSEIVDAARRVAERVAADELSTDDITEECFADHLYTAGMCDPDLVVRTAGEMRVSNFLLWQISYAELWVTEKCWPEFREPDLHAALAAFGNRVRRFGGLKS